MRLSRKGDYALRAVIQLALSEGIPRSITHVSNAGGIPRNFAAKILKELTDAGLLKSYPGKTGGYTLKKMPENISFREIIEAVEGPIVINRCLDETGDCARMSICRMYNAWKNTQEKMLGLLDDVKIGDVITPEAVPFEVEDV
ncbi:MAG: Rrf2 family transcriptional regulator [candidate division Zixibacteria bacterium]|nr:Rrf2 family transcriptional regulator [candidate division Zixibacteria bacterium]